MCFLPLFVLPTYRARSAHVQNSVQRLVYFAVSENDPLTRSAVLDKLTSKWVVVSITFINNFYRQFSFSRFDPFLSAPSCTTALAQALHDEDVGARRSALRLFTRLAHRQEGTMLQNVNQMLVELLTILQFEMCYVTKDKAAKLLSQMNYIDNLLLIYYFCELLIFYSKFNIVQYFQYYFICSTGDLVIYGSPLIKPYAKTVLSHFVRKLKEAQLELLSYNKNVTPPSPKPASHENWNYDFNSTATPPMLSGPDPSPAQSTGRLVQVGQCLGQDENKDSVLSPDAESRIAVLRNTVQSLLIAVTSLCGVMTKYELADGYEHLVEVLLGFLRMDSTWLVDTLLALAALWGSAW